MASRTVSLHERPDLVASHGERLSRLERVQIRAIRNTFEPGALDRALRWCQRSVGQQWIHHSTKHLCRLHGLDRLPILDPKKSYVCVSNHRSFFDMYVITANLVRRGLPHRIVFPVRSNFFYDNPAGFVVNGVMSFFAMYPPIFRERKRLALNATSVDELIWLLKRGGCFTGMHPEGTRKLDDDPYTFLPTQRGVGRIVHGSGATVLPVFINGLINDLPRQIASNFDGTGTKVNIVFGEPVALDDLLAKPASNANDKAIADRIMKVVAELGAEERRLRHGEMAPATTADAAE